VVEFTKGSLGKKANTASGGQKGVTGSGEGDADSPQSSLSYSKEVARRAVEKKRSRGVFFGFFGGREGWRGELGGREETEGSDLLRLVNRDFWKAA